MYIHYIPARTEVKVKPSKERTLWYYRSLADRFCTLLPGQLSEELREIGDVLERAT